MKVFDGGQLQLCVVCIGIYQVGGLQNSVNTSQDSLHPDRVLHLVPHYQRLIRSRETLIPSLELLPSPGERISWLTGRLGVGRVVNIILFTHFTVHQLLPYSRLPSLDTVQHHQARWGQIKILIKWTEIKNRIQNKHQASPLSSNPTFSQSMELEANIFSCE